MRRAYFEFGTFVDYLTGAPAWEQIDSDHRAYWNNEPERTANDVAAYLRARAAELTKLADV